MASGELCANADVAIKTAKNILNKKTIFTSYSKRF
jgi:hypothetical protein